MSERRSLQPALALGVAMFLPAFGTHGLNAGRDALAAALELPRGDARMGLLMAAFALAAVAAYAWVGSWGDRGGLRRTLLWGVRLFVASHALMLAAPAFAQATGVPRWLLFLALRLLAGFAGGAITVSANALGTVLYPPEQRGRAMSLVWLGVPLALVVGVPLPPLVQPWLDALPASARPWFGEPYVLVALATGLLAWAGLGRVLPHDAPAAAPAAGDQAPLPSLRATWWAYAASFLMPVAVFPLIVSADPYAQRALAFSGPQRSQLLVVLGVASVAGGLLSSLVADRLGRRRTLLASLATFAALTALLPACGALAYVALAAALGLVSTLRQGPFQALASFLADQRGRGRLSARILISSQLGISGGQYAGVALLRQGAPGAESGAPTLVPIVVFSVACSLAALSLAWQLREPAPVHG